MEKVDINHHVRLRRGVDVMTLPLGAQEGFILSRIDGSTAVRSIVNATGLVQTAVLDTLQHLIQMGAIHIDHNLDGQIEEEEDLRPFTLTEPQKDEKVDLAPDMRLRVLQVAWECRRGTLYGVLGVGRRASAEEITRAYYERSREFHPDAFFRKELGSYRPLLDTIFKTVKKASDTLSDPGKRSSYDLTLPKEGTAPKPARAEPPRVLDPRRQKEAEDRRLRRNPLVERVAKARRHLDRARELATAKQWQGAANELALAAAQDPKNAAILALNAEVQVELRKDKFQKNCLRIEFVCAADEPDEAVLGRLVKDLVESEGGEPAPLVRAAKALVNVKLHRLARGPADKAHKLAPDDPSALSMVIDLMTYEEMYLNAARLAERLYKVAPTPERKAKMEHLKQRADNKR